MFTLASKEITPICLVSDTYSTWLEKTLLSCGAVGLIGKEGAKARHTPANVGAERRRPPTTLSSKSDAKRRVSKGCSSRRAALCAWSSFDRLSGLAVTAWRLRKGKKSCQILELRSRPLATRGSELRGCDMRRGIGLPGFYQAVAGEDCDGRSKKRA